MPKKLDGKRIFYIIITSIIAIVIFYASGIKSTEGVPGGFNLATFYHFSIFFAFTFFLSLAILKKKLTPKIIILILSISLIYALSDEFHQLFVPGRFCSLRDVLIDFSGSVLSVLTLKIFEKLNKL